MFFQKDGLGIEQPTEIDIPLNKETKPPHYLPFALRDAIKGNYSI